MRARRGYAGDPRLALERDCVMESRHAAAESPGVQAMVERFVTNQPAGIQPEEEGAFIFREGFDSAMEREQSARHFT